MNMLVVSIFLSVAAKSIIEALAEPVRKKFPDLDLWWLIYVTWAVGGALSYLAGITLFGEVVPTLEPMLDRVLTAIVVGGGSSLIYNIFDKKAAP